MFNLHRFGQRNDALVLAKLTTLGHIDSELRTLETALREREPVTVLREAGITACPRCAAIHGSEDRFCPNCGLPMSRHVDLPVAGAPAAASPGDRRPGAHRRRRRPPAGPGPAGALGTARPRGAARSGAASRRRRARPARRRRRPPSERRARAPVAGARRAAGPTPAAGQPAQSRPRRGPAAPQPRPEEADRDHPPATAGS